MPMTARRRPHGSAQTVEVPETQVYTVRHGKIVEVREYPTKAEALKSWAFRSRPSRRRTWRSSAVLPTRRALPTRRTTLIRPEPVPVSMAVILGRVAVARLRIFHTPHSANAPRCSGDERSSQWRH
jgi:hypothetical protein